MSNDLKAKARLWSVQASVNKMVLDDIRDADEVADCLQKFINEKPVERSLITVDRTTHPTYPSWMESVLYPELENTGPSEFDVGNLDRWLHDSQKTGVVTGNVVHEHLKSNNMLEGCLGLRDLEEIQKKGIVFFRERFKGKAVFGWKSIVRGAGANLCAPYLVERDGEVVLSWSWLAHFWSSSNLALRFAS